MEDAWLIAAGLGAPRTEEQATNAYITLLPSGPRQSVPGDAVC